MVVGLPIIIFLVLPSFFRVMAGGKIFCFFIEDDGFINTKLKKPMYNNEYIVDKDGAYEIVPDRVGLTNFPKGLFPAWFQTTIPAMLLRRDHPIPEEINNPTSLKYTAKEAKMALEPHFLRALAEKSKEGIVPDKRAKMLQMITAGAAVICLIVLLYLASKMGGCGIGGG
jgi:hypothetical protein